MPLNVGPRRATVSEINVTPMADIMIVLLVIFMVATPLISQGPVKNLPPAMNSDQEAEGPPTVSVAADGTTYLGGARLAAPGDLRSRLQAVLEERGEADRVVYLKADESLPYATIARVIDSCREGGATEIAFLSRRRPGF